MSKFLTYLLTLILVLGLLMYLFGGRQTPVPPASPETPTENGIKTENHQTPEAPPEKAPEVPEIEVIPEPVPTPETHVEKNVPAQVAADLRAAEM